MHGIIFMLMMGVVSCEKVDIPQMNANSVQEDGVSVRLSISSIEQVSFDVRKSNTRASGIADYCGRITFAFFQGAEKVKMISQKASDSDFGMLQTTLPAGKYELVVIAHNGNGNPSVTSAEEIYFDSKVTMSDTFYYYGELDASKPQDLNIALMRVVAMVRFVIADNVPMGVRKMKFYYTGGSSTFNAVTGYGSKNSRQTEYRDVEEAAHTSESYYDIYTFPHENEDVLTLTVTALNADETTYKEQKFENIPVKINQITKYTGTFFGDTQQGGDWQKFTLSLSNTEWNEEECHY